MHQSKIDPRLHFEDLKLYSIQWNNRIEIWKDIQIYTKYSLFLESMVEEKTMSFAPNPMQCKSEICLWLWYTINYDDRTIPT